MIIGIQLRTLMLFEPIIRRAQRGFAWDACQIGVIVSFVPLIVGSRADILMSSIDRTGSMIARRAMVGHVRTKQETSSSRRIQLFWRF